MLFVLFISLVAVAGLMLWTLKHYKVDLPFKIILALTLFACGACVPAYGADMVPAHQVAAPSFGTALQAFLEQTVFPIISALVLGLASLFLTRLGKKYKVQSLTEENNFLFRLAAQGVALAEEWAAKRAGGATRLTGMEKMDIAIGHILTYAPKISPKQAEDIVHSVLAQIPGAGATGEAVTLLPQEGGYSIPIPGIPVTEDIFAGPAPVQ